MKKSLYILSFLCFWTGAGGLLPAYGQLTPTIEEDGDLSPFLADYVTGDEDIYVSVLSAFQGTVRGRLKIQVILGTDTVAFTRVNRMPLIDIPPDGKDIRYTDLIGVTESQLFIDREVRIAAELSSRLPAGEYQFCVQVKTEDGTLYPPVPMCTPPICIGDITPPFIVTPWDRDVLCINQGPQVVATAISPASKTAEYILRIFEKPDNVEPEALILSDTANLLLEKGPSLNPTFNIYEDEMPFDYEGGQDVVIQVVAVDALGKQIGNPSLGDIRTVHLTRCDTVPNDTVSSSGNPDSTGTDPGGKDPSGNQGDDGEPAGGDTDANGNPVGQVDSKGDSNGNGDKKNDGYTNFVSEDDSVKTIRVSMPKDSCKKPDASGHLGGEVAYSGAVGEEVELGRRGKRGLSYLWRDGPNRQAVGPKATFQIEEKPRTISLCVSNCNDVQDWANVQLVPNDTFDIKWESGNGFLCAFPMSPSGESLLPPLDTQPLEVIQSPTVQFAIPAPTSVFTFKFLNSRGNTTPYSNCITTDKIRKQRECVDVSNGLIAVKSCYDTDPFPWQHGPIPDLSVGGSVSSGGGLFWFGDGIGPGGYIPVTGVAYELVDDTGNTVATGTECCPTGLPNGSVSLDGINSVENPLAPGGYTVNYMAENHSAMLGLPGSFVESSFSFQVH